MELTNATVATTLELSPDQLVHEYFRISVTFAQITEPEDRQMFFRTTVHHAFPDRQHHLLQKKLWERLRARL